RYAASLARAATAARLARSSLAIAAVSGDTQLRRRIERLVAPPATIRATRLGELVVPVPAAAVAASIWLFPGVTLAPPSASLAAFTAAPVHAFPSRASVAPGALPQSGKEAPEATAQPATALAVLPGGV